MRQGNDSPPVFGASSVEGGLEETATGRTTHHHAHKVSAPPETPSFHGACLKIDPDTNFQRSSPRGDSVPLKRGR